VGLTSSASFHGGSLLLCEVIPQSKPVLSGTEILSAKGALEAAIYDLNNDGYLDLVFANENNGSTSYIDSYIYWGSATGFSTTSRTGLPTNKASAVRIVGSGS
jgi:hypothetical protein